MRNQQILMIVMAASIMPLNGCLGSGGALPDAH